MVYEKTNLHPTGEKQQRGKMIIPKNLNQVTLKKVETGVTGKMGLGWTYHCMKHYGLEEIIDKYCPRKSGSNREISGSRKIIAGALTAIAGGEKIEDIEILRADKALLDTLGWKSMASPDTLREFFMKKKNVKKIKKVNAEATKWTIKTLRYWFIHTCEKIIRTGRKYFCNIINATDKTFELFRRCLSQLVVT